MHSKQDLNKIALLASLCSVPSRSKKYRSPAAVKFWAASDGATTLPRVLDIFSLSTVQWEFTERHAGGSKPAAIRNAGQYTPWNLEHKRNVLGMITKHFLIKSLKVLSAKS